MSSRPRYHTCTQNGLCFRANIQRYRESSSLSLLRWAKMAELLPFWLSESAFSNVWQIIVTGPENASTPAVVVESSGRKADGPMAMPGHEAR